MARGDQRASTQSQLSAARRCVFVLYKSNKSSLSVQQASTPLLVCGSLISCLNELPPVLAISLTISVPPQGLYTLLRIDEARCAMEIPLAVQAAQRQASRLRIG